MNEALCECCLPLMCDCCRREVSQRDLRHTQWHGRYAMCMECLETWYDPPSGVDNTMAESIGDYVRRRHGLGSAYGVKGTDK